MEDVKRYGLVLLKSVTVIHEVKNGEYVEYNDYKELADKLEAVNYNLKKKNYNLVASLAAANDRALVYRVKWEQADKRIGALTAACKHKDGIIKKLHESLESLCVFNPEIYQISKINSVLKVAKAELGEPVPCAACKRKDGAIEELEKRACCAIGALVTIHNKLKPCGLKKTTNVLQEVIETLKNGPTKAELGKGEG